MSKPRAMKGKRPGPRVYPGMVQQREPIELLILGATQLLEIVRELGEHRDYRAALEQWLSAQEDEDEIRVTVAGILCAAHPDKYGLRPPTDPADPPADSEESAPASAEPPETDSPHPALEPEPTPPS